MIRFDGVTKYYGRQRGIEDLSLSVKAGTITGLVGPNGAGKTTLLRILLGLLRRDRGSLFFQEHPFRPSLDCIGYCGDSVDFYTEISAHRLFSYAARLRGGMRALNRAMELSVRFELDTRKKIKELSKGNTKKVQIILAFMETAPLVVLDEPTNGLDPMTQHDFFRFLQEERAGGTILISSHQLYDVERVCDEVAFIREGRVFQHLAIQELRAGMTTDIVLTMSSGSVGEPSLVPLGDGRYLLRTKEPMEALRRLLAERDIQDIEVKKTSLEQFFLTRYRSGDPPL